MQKARYFSTKVPCRRWPLQVFYNRMDFAAINASILHNKVPSRIKFILHLVDKLRWVVVKDENSREENVSHTKASSKKRKLTRSKCQVECKKNKLFDECSNCLKYC